MAEPVYVNPSCIHHFAFDPRASASQMAQVNVEGVQLFPHTYHHTGREFVIPADGGHIVVFLCHVPANDHWVHPRECSLLKYPYDPWYVCTAVMLTNTHPDLDLYVPTNCDLYALTRYTTVELMTVSEADFFAYFFN
jgi:hypothetical protein